MVPLVSLRPAHAPRLRPVHRAPHFPLGHRPAVFFGLVLLSASRALSLSLSLSLWCRLPRLCVQIQEITRGWPTRRRPQLLSRLFLGCFLGKSIGQCPRQTVLSRTVGAPPTSSRSPLKYGAGRGSGGGNRIVTQMRSLGIGQVLSRNFQLTLPLVEGGNAVRFSLLCFFSVWFLSFAVFWQSSLLLRVGYCEKFSGANFCFCFLFGPLCF